MSQASVRQEVHKIENIYFQIVLLQLVPTNLGLEEGQQIKLSINRGKQVFEETKNISVHTVDECIPLNRARLNFIVFTYDSKKSYEFTLKLKRLIRDQEIQIGEYNFDVNCYADAYLQSANGAFRDEFILNEEAKVEVELYAEKSRYSLQKLVRDINNPKSKVMLEGDGNLFQRITEKKARIERDRSDSPKKQKESPRKRSSPRKQRLELAALSKISVQEELSASKFEPKKEMEAELAVNEQQPVNEVIQDIEKSPKSPKQYIIQPTSQEQQKQSPAYFQEIHLSQPQKPVISIEQQVLVDGIDISPLHQNIIEKVGQSIEEVQLKEDIHTDQIASEQIKIAEEIKEPEPIISPKEEPVKITLEKAVQIVKLAEEELAVEATEDVIRQDTKDEVLQVQVLRTEPLPLKYKAAFAILLFIFLLASNFVEQRQKVSAPTEVINDTLRNNKTLSQKQKTVEKKSKQAIPKKRKKKHQ